MYKITNEWGYSLVEFIKVTERELKYNKDFSPLKSSLILVDCNEKYLIGFHKKRNQWEFPGGSIEKGESPKECAIRELFEETNQSIDNAELVGLAKLHNGKKDEIEYLALYHTVVDEIIPFTENEEIKDIMLWNLENDIGRYDIITKYMFNFLQAK